MRISLTSSPATAKGLLSQMHAPSGPSSPLYLFIHPILPAWFTDGIVSGSKWWSCGVKQRIKNIKMNVMFFMMPDLSCPSINKVSHTSLFVLIWISGSTGLKGVKWSSILSKHGHGDSHWDNKPPREPGCPANILPASPLPAPPPSAQDCDPT